MEFYFLLTVEVTDAGGLGSDSLSGHRGGGEELKLEETSLCTPSNKLKFCLKLSLSVPICRLGIITTSRAEREDK